MSEETNTEYDQLAAQVNDKMAFLSSMGMVPLDPSQMITIKLGLFVTAVSEVLAEAEIAEGFEESFEIMWMSILNDVCDQVIGSRNGDNPGSGLYVVGGNSTATEEEE